MRLEGLPLMPVRFMEWKAVENGGMCSNKRVTAYNPMVLTNEQFLVVGGSGRRKIDPPETRVVIYIL